MKASKVSHFFSSNNLATGTLIMSTIAGTLLFPSISWADDATFDPTSGVLHIPKLEVPTPLSKGVECYEADLGFMPNSEMIAFSFIGATPVSCNDVVLCDENTRGTAAYNECQTRHLQGTWSFVFMNTNTGIATMRTYHLGEVAVDTETSGGYVISGINQEENTVIEGGYDPEDDNFGWFEKNSMGAILPDAILSFSFLYENTVIGCYFTFEEALELVETTQTVPTCPSFGMGVRLPVTSVRSLSQQSNTYQARKNPFSSYHFIKKHVAKGQ